MSVSYVIDCALKQGVLISMALASPGVSSACRDYDSTPLNWPLTTVNFRKTRFRGNPTRPP